MKFDVKLTVWYRVDAASEVEAEKDAMRRLGEDQASPNQDGVPHRYFSVQAASPFPLMHPGVIQ